MKTVIAFDEDASADDSTGVFQKVWEREFGECIPKPPNPPTYEEFYAAAQVIQSFLAHTYEGLGRDNIQISQKDVHLIIFDKNGDVDWIDIKPGKKTQNIMEIAKRAICVASDFITKQNTIEGVAAAKILTRQTEIINSLH